MANTDMEKLVSLCKRRGYVFQSSEIYGGINGFWDYGPLGVEMRQNIRRLWWKRMVHDRDDVVGQDAAIVGHPRVWEASGHVEHFHDPMADCKVCKKRFRADHIEGKNCPECGGELTEARQFNLMFKTFVGANEDKASVAYLRPETCQAIFANFKVLQMATRQKIPFGVAQMEKLRNEITPRNFIFRSREFEQMEMEFFVHPKESAKWFEYWLETRRQWFLDLGIQEKKIRLRPHEKDELAHYALGCSDVEYEFYFGWQELEGIANRSDYDLTQHAKHSGKDLSYFNEETQEKFIPAVIETSVGLDRTFLVLLTDAYYEEEVQEEDRTETRIVLKLHPQVAPIEMAIFPLSKKLNEPAAKLEKDLRKDFRTIFDSAGSIGKRYRRVDEIGAPFAVTYDFQSTEDEAVTVRNRDTMVQDRVAISQLKDFMRNKIGTF